MNLEWARTGVFRALNSYVRTSRAHYVYFRTDMENERDHLAKGKHETKKWGSESSEVHDKSEEGYDALVASYGRDDMGRER